MKIRFKKKLPVSLLSNRMKYLLIVFTCTTLFSCLRKKCDPVDPVITPPGCSHLITQWSSQTSVNSNNLGTSSFIDMNTGWIVGANGTILKTIDGGATFSPQSSGTSQLLARIFFLDGSNGYAGGGNSDPSGILLKTINGGTTWTPVLNNVEAVRALFFFNKDVGFAAGSLGIMRKTIDAGLTWSTVNTGVSFGIYDIQFVDSNIGYACGANGGIIKSTDGGQNWTSLTNTMPKGLNDGYFALDFLDANNGYATGYSSSNGLGYVIKTTNGGQTWSYININSIGLADIKMVDNNTAYVVGGAIGGGSGGIYKVTNGNTLSLDKASSDRLSGFSFLGCNKAIVSGNAGIIIQGN